MCGRETFRLAREDDSLEALGNVTVQLFSNREDLATTSPNPIFQHRADVQ